MYNQIPWGKLITRLFPWVKLLPDTIVWPKRTGYGIRLLSDATSFHTLSVRISIVFLTMEISEFTRNDNKNRSHRKWRQQFP